MADDITFNCVFQIVPGRFGEFKTLVRSMVEMSKQESGCLAYEYSVSEDNLTVHIVERYQDSDAILHHLSETFSKVAKEFDELASCSSFVIVGTASEQVQSLLAGANPIYVRNFDGFSK